MASAGPSPPAAVCPGEPMIGRRGWVIPQCHRLVTSGWGALTLDPDPQSMWKGDKIFEARDRAADERLSVTAWDAGLRLLPRTASSGRDGVDGRVSVSTKTLVDLAALGSNRP